METGTEAVLLVASGIGSRAIVFVVTPAVPPASACQLLYVMLCFVFSPNNNGRKNKVTSICWKLAGRFSPGSLIFFVLIVAIIVAIIDGISEYPILILVT